MAKSREGCRSVPGAGGVTTTHVPVPVRVIGGPTVLIGYGGLRLLTDPTFDTPRDYPVGNGFVLTRTAAPVVSPDELGPIDAVLLSHDEHPDNLDHGPDGCEPVTGEVIGFLLTPADLPTVYVSGDNASLDVVRDIADRFGPVDTAVLFAGGARTARLDGALLTLDSARSAEAARILGARRVVAAHADGWTHFTEGHDELEAAFAEAGPADRLA